MTRILPGFEDHTVCSEPFRKFSILPDSSTAYQHADSSRDGQI